MRVRRWWLVLLGLGVPTLVATSDPGLLVGTSGLVEDLLLVLVTLAAAWGAIRNAPTKPVVGWLITAVVALNTLNGLLPERSLLLILLGFVCGLGAIGVILAAHRDRGSVGSALDALVATMGPFAVIVVVARAQALPADAPAVLVANFVVLLLVAFTVSLAYRVPVALRYGLAAIALSTVTDVAGLMHTPFTSGVANFLSSLPLLLLAVSTLHPTFAEVTTPVPLEDQRHRVVRVLLLAGSLGTTVALTFTDPEFLATHGATLSAAPLALVALIGLRIVQWIRDLDRSAQVARDQADFDPLTGLRSIQGLRAFVEDAAASSRPPTGWSAIAFDLDGFRRINDAFGMSVGDAVLGAVAATLRFITPEGGAAARLGADEFAILLPGTDKLRARRTALAGVAALRELVDAGSDLGRLSLPASAGTASAPAGPGIIDQLISQALTAVGDVQRTGGPRVAEFEPTMAATASADLRMLRGLQRALTDDVGEIEPAFQPIVDVRTGRTVAVEALARWTTPDGRTIDPDRYLALAETSGWISQLGQLMLRRSCQELVRRRQQEPDLRMHVNVSPVEASQPSFVPTTLTTIQRAGLPLDALVLEITEQVLLPDASTALDAFLTLEEEGLSLALDDFGTGYASVGYLNRLQLDYIKVDRAFIAELGSEKALLEDLLPFLTARGATVIAEGVETPEQLARLKDLGCAMAQGYLLGRPSRDGTPQPVDGGSPIGQAPT